MKESLRLFCFDFWFQCKPLDLGGATPGIILHGIFSNFKVQ